MTNSTTGNPNNGLVYLTLSGHDASGNPITVQASGILLSDDEVLTAAHVVYNSDGTLRTVGTASVGYDAGTSIATSKIDGVQAQAMQNYSTVAGMGSDFAVVHLSTAISGGTIFSLGSDLTSGSFTVSGYPAGTSGHLDTKTETLSVASGTNVYVGETLHDGTGNPAGSSGGAIYQVINGVPTAYGIISAESSSNSAIGYFKELTASDVQQIQSWVATADKGGSAGGGTGTNPNPVSHSAPGFSQDIATMLSADAANYSGTKSAVMTEVASAISKACADGGTFANMTQDAVAYINSQPSFAKQALSYLSGLLSGTTNVWNNNLAKTANQIIAGSVTDVTSRNFASAGRTEGLGMGISGTANINTAHIVNSSFATLASAISGPANQGIASQTFTPMNSDAPSTLSAGSYFRH